MGAVSPRNASSFLSKTSENHLRGKRYRRAFDDSPLLTHGRIPSGSILCGPGTGRAWRPLESYTCKLLTFKLAVLKRRQSGWRVMGKPEVELPRRLSLD
jgi:hypothetical protein